MEKNNLRNLPTTMQDNCLKIMIQLLRPPPSLLLFVKASWWVSTFTAYF